MKNYEKITAIINSGHLALCQSEWYYKIYSKICTNWNIRNSICSNEIRDCLDTLWMTFESKEFINEDNFTSIKPYAIKPKLLKKWDMVDILEVARESGSYYSWTDIKKEMVWKWPFEIYCVNDDIDWISYNIYKKDKKGSAVFPHYAVCKHIEETITIEAKDGQSLEISKEKAIELGFIINE